MTTQEDRAEQRKLWGELIAEQKQSGKSISGFCRARGQKAHLFYYWRQRLTSDSAAEKAVRFALVETNGGVPVRERIEILLDSGEKLRVAPGADAATLRMVLGVLREARA
jgi:transposase-like protein